MCSRRAERYNCDLCGKTFGCENNLKRHIESVHENQRSFTCEACSKVFVSKKTLRQHKCVHAVQTNPKKQFLCDICNKVFGTRPHLARHLKCVHEQIKDFSCQTCGKPFGCENNLKRHIETVHMNLRPFKCDICSKAFGLKKTLQEHRCHVPSAHPETFVQGSGQVTIQNIIADSDMKLAHKQPSDWNQI